MAAKELQGLRQLLDALKPGGGATISRNGVDITEEQIAMLEREIAQIERAIGGATNA